MGSGDLRGPYLSFREGGRPELQGRGGRTDETDRGDEVGGNGMQEARLSLARAAAAALARSSAGEACGGG